MTQKQKTMKPRKTYTQEEAVKASEAYFKGDTLASNIWVNKYALKDSAGNIYEATPDDMHRRIANEIARIDERYPSPMTSDQIFELIKGFKYIVPQGSPMTGIGNEFQIASLSNCFVIGGDEESDSYGGVMLRDQEQVQLMKRRGGVGHDLSHIRPKGSPVKNSALTSTGLVPFMERFSNSTREVAQDGRRGALMLSVSIEHPDSEAFVDAKLEQGKVTGANISVRITDKFMESVAQGTEFIQQFPVGSANPKVSQKIKATELWNKIIHNAWKSAEPGILFWDTIINESLPDCYADLGYKTLSTNPCGEIPLCANDSCRLLALNLFSYVNNPFTEHASFDFDLFKTHVAHAHRIMDNIIDIEIEKIDAILKKIDSDPEDIEVKRVERNLWTNIQKKAAEGRRAGIGITAEGDMLAALGIRYGTDESTEFSTKVHKTLAVETYRASVNLAKERGAFPIFDSSREVNNPFMLRLKAEDEELYNDMLKYGRRNIALLTIAPTGTVSIMTQTTSGVEPVFKVLYKRRVKVNSNDKNARVDFVDSEGDEWTDHIVIHHKFLDWMNVNGYDSSKQYTGADIDFLEGLVKQSPYYKADSGDVDYLKKVQMQGSIQKWVDHSISVTINMPSDTTEELVGQVYMEAWRSGCKGVTVYREGSRSGVLISTDQDKNTSDSTEGASNGEFHAFPTERPEILVADVVRFQNNKEKWIAFIGKIGDLPYEIFTGLADDEDGITVPRWVTEGLIIKNRSEDGQSRYDFQFENKRGYKTTIEGLSHKFNPEYWNYAKLISSVLRHGMPMDKLIDLVGSLQLDSDHINTWKAGVARALKRYIPEGTELKGKTCESCQSTSITYKEGCMICLSCGSSKCG